MILIGLLLSCYTTEWLGVHFIFGAFIFGTVMPRSEALRHEVLERLEQVSVLLLLPVFFVLAGMRVDLSTVDLRGFVELLLILAVAIGGKFIGAYLGARLQHVPSRQAGALATLMNTRGLTEIVILTVGLQLGILDGTLFSLMVVMALVTTVMAGPLLAWIYPRSRVERDIAQAERAALGSGSYRVFVVAPDPSSVGLASDLAAGQPQRPAEVVLSRLVPYENPGRLEVGSGLSGDLLEMTRVMGELEALAAPVRARGLGVPVLARLSADPARDLQAQIAATTPDIVVAPSASPTLDAPVVVTVVAPFPETWSVVVARADGGSAAEAILRVAAALATARDGALVLKGRPPRRVVEALTRGGVRLSAAEAPPGALIVGGDGHLDVRGLR